MKKNYRGVRKWIKGLDKTKTSLIGISKNRKPNGYSLSIQFPRAKKLRDHRDVWYKKNGELYKRVIKKG